MPVGTMYAEAVASPVVSVVPPVNVTEGAEVYPDPTATSEMLDTPPPESVATALAPLPPPPVNPTTGVDV
jgi:hypothetical protein